MNSLEQMYPSLTLFSDLSWEKVKIEYESDYSDLSFPEYLQQKCVEGDCPPYLFELAFFEQALFELKAMTEINPSQDGIYLNPYSLFLNLDFDIKRMLDDASLGKIDVHEKQHVICLFRDKEHKISILEATDEDLFLLQKLEEGPREDESFVDKNQKNIYEKFLESGLIWKISSR
jgi:hypothetical protein